MMRSDKKILGGGGYSHQPGGKEVTDEDEATGEKLQ